MRVSRSFCGWQMVWRPADSLGPMGGMFMGVKSQPIPGSPGPPQVSAQSDEKALFWGQEGPPFKPLPPTH